MLDRFVIAAVCLNVSCAVSSSSVTPLSNDAGYSDGVAPTSDALSVPLDVVFSTDVQQDSIQGCDPKTFVLKPGHPARSMLVFDRSGSMVWDGATVGKSRWKELVEGVDASLSQYQSSVKFGLLMFPSGSSCHTQGPQIVPALDQHIKIMKELWASRLEGGTPTSDALIKAGAALDNLSTDGAPKVIILATDGGPNCNYNINWDCSCAYAASDYCCTLFPEDQCDDGDASNCLDDEGTLETVRGLRSRGIDTVVVGLPGTDQYIALLNELAVSGGRPRAGDRKYYAASGAAEISSVFGEIAGALISCRLELDEAPTLPDAVSVYVDGHLVARDKSGKDGWDYEDQSNRAILLHGAACEVLRAGGAHAVTATFACVVK